MASGRDTREYTSVLGQMTTITDYLKVNNGSRDTLIQKYQQEQWIPITEQPDAGGLVTIALNRISTDARQYDVFIDMLKDITGMDIIVERIQGDRASGGTQPAASPQPECLGIDDLQDVVAKLLPAASKWRSIGLALRLSDGDLETVRDDNQRTQERLTGMLRLWLNRSYDVARHGQPSWAKLREAVRSPAGGGNPALADKLP